MYYYTILNDKFTFINMKPVNESDKQFILFKLFQLC